MSLGEREREVGERERETPPARRSGAGGGGRGVGATQGNGKTEDEAIMAEDGGGRTTEDVAGGAGGAGGGSGANGMGAFKRAGYTGAGCDTLGH